MKRLSLFLLLGFPCVSGAVQTTYYISVNGNDANNCTSAQDPATPKKTLASLFGCGSAGDIYVAMSTGSRTNYTYATNGTPTYDDGSCSNCAQVPSGTSKSNMTIFKSTDVTKTISFNSGSRVYSLFIGRSNRKDQFIRVEGLTFEGGGTIYNGDNNYITTCGFHATWEDGGDIFGVGTNDGNWGNKGNLIEDVWIWGRNRAIGSNYRATATIWRRVIIRGDGCNTASCTGSGNPNIGFTVYNSSVVSVQNMIQLDRVLDGAEPYADFATAQHDAGGVDLGSAEYNKQNEWLGCMSLNSGDTGFNFECDGCTSPSVRMKDCAAINIHGGGFNIGSANVGVNLQNMTALSGSLAGESGFRLAPGVTGSIFNVISSTFPQWGVNSAVTPSYSDVFNSGVDDYNQTTCSVGCLTSNPRADGTPTSIKYPVRIETGSALKGTGSGSADYGANIVKQYGTTGTFSGDTSSNTLSSTNLWPWPNEARIRTELCTGNSSNWCAGSKTLTTYVWEFLGNTIPEDVYGESSSSPSPPKVSGKGNLSFRGNIRFK